MTRPERYAAIIARNDAIRRLKQWGAPDAAIAAQFGIGITTVGKIKVGRT